MDTSPRSEFIMAGWFWPVLILLLAVIVWCIIRLNQTEQDRERMYEGSRMQDQWRQEQQ